MKLNVTTHSIRHPSALEPVAVQWVLAVRFTHKLPDGSVGGVRCCLSFLLDRCLCAVLYDISFANPQRSGNSFPYRYLIPKYLGIRERPFWRLSLVNVINQLCLITLLLMICVQLITRGHYEAVNFFNNPADIRILPAPQFYSICLRNAPCLRYVAAAAYTATCCRCAVTQDIGTKLLKELKFLEAFS